MNRPTDTPVQTFQDTRPSTPPLADPEAAPLLEPGHLDALWFQVTGTVCNLECVHCFISCSPTNRSFEYLSFDDVAHRLAESVPLGVREFYFTGGEPFIHPDIVEILVLALEYGPTTVLTNGTLLKGAQLRRLAAAAVDSPYSLEFRVSIDGFDAATHDEIRGAGSFARVVRGVELLLAHGFLPIVTAVQTWELGAEPEVYRGFVEMLRSRGYAHPRVKLLPALRLGAEAERSGGYRESDRVISAMLEGHDLDPFICSNARVVTDRGIWVCPILLEAPDGNLGDDLAEAASTPFRLRHRACHTCWRYGAICSNPGSVAPETGIAGDGERLPSRARERESAVRS